MSKVLWFYANKNRFIPIFYFKKYLYLAVNQLAYSTIALSNKGPGFDLNQIKMQI